MSTLLSCEIGAWELNGVWKFVLFRFEIFCGIRAWELNAAKKLWGKNFGATTMHALLCKPTNDNGKCMRPKLCQEKICQTKYLNFFTCSDYKIFYHFGQKISNLNRAYKKTSVDYFRVVLCTHQRQTSYYMGPAN